MTEKRSTKTIIGLIIAGVLSIIVALGALGYFQFYQTADNLYKQGKIFGTSTMKDEETVACKNYVRSTWFYRKCQRKWHRPLFYRIFRSRYWSYDYSTIEIKKGDKLADKIKSADVDTPVIVAAKMRKSGADGAIRDYTINFKDLISENETVSKRAETEYYVSVYEFDKDRQSHTS